MRPGEGERVSEAEGVSGLGVPLKGAIRVPKKGIYKGSIGF